MKTMQNLIATFAALTVTALAEEPPTLAVVNFTGRDYTELARKLPELLEDKIVNGGLFSVVERQKLDSVVEEMGLQQSGQVDVDTAVRMGRLSGARFLLTGSIVDAGDDVRAFNGYGTHIRTTTKRCTVKAKLVDAEKGRIVFSTSVDGAMPVYESSHLHASGSGPWMTMAKDLSDQITRKLAAADFLKAYQASTPSRVKVRFNTTPAGADVEVGRILVGNGGQEIEVPAGQQEVTVSLPGYAEWKKTAELRDGLTINVSLKRLTDPDVKIAVEASTAQAGTR